MNILITGGTGFIGSHLSLKLLENYNKITIVDDFSTGNNFGLENVEVINCNILNYNKLLKSLIGKKFDCLIHLASKSLVADSFLQEEQYIQTNVGGTKNVIRLCEEIKIERIIFASSASVYGNDHLNKTIHETFETKPINPYGVTKLECEQILKNAFKQNNISSICFRFFNACGGDPLLRTGEWHNPETHLIPKLIRTCLENSKKNFFVYGNNFNTADGYAVRDFLNVIDICSAIENGVQWLDNNSGFEIINLGSGRSYSVIDVIEETEKYLNKKIPIKIVNKRIGEPDFLLSDISKANKMLGWKPFNSDLKQIVEVTAKWQSKMLESTKTTIQNNL